jgi:hypothetical protein
MVLLCLLGGSSLFKLLQVQVLFDASSWHCLWKLGKSKLQLQFFLTIPPFYTRFILVVGCNPLHRMTKFMNKQKVPLQVMSNILVS